MHDKPLRDEPCQTGDLLNALSRAWPPAAWKDVDVALAISGGCDSMALLRAMLALKEQHGGRGRVRAFHVNHRLRAAESEEDEAWCREACRLLGVALTVLRGAAQKRSQSEGDGLEAAARNERYELLTQAAESAGVRYLATAHTQNDQVETVLFRLLRGSGMRGLRGIPRTRELTPAVTLLRPLLGCSRAMLEAYLGLLGQSYRTDSSNQDRRFARNRLRHELLPKLRKDFNQDVDTAILRLAAQAEAAQQLIETQAREVLRQCEIKPTASSNECGELSLDLPLLAQQADVVVCEALRLAWREAGLAEQAMTYQWWRKMAELVKSPSRGEILNLPGGVRASTVDGRLFLQWGEWGG